PPPPTTPHSSPLFPYTPLFRSISLFFTEIFEGKHGDALLRNDFACVAGNKLALKNVRCCQHGDDNHGGRQRAVGKPTAPLLFRGDRKSTRLNSSHRTISYAVFC